MFEITIFELDLSYLIVALTILLFQKKKKKKSNDENANINTKPSIIKIL
jgi:hypothetical protein